MSGPDVQTGGARPGRSGRDSMDGGLLLDRRLFLQGACGLAAAVAHGGPAAFAGPSAPSLPADEIRRLVREAMPSRGGPIPADLPARLGTALAGAKYGLSAEPILVEGAERIIATGARAAKFWLFDLANVYAVHSDWRGLAKQAPFVERISHPYFRQALAQPFETVALEVNWAPGTRPFAADEDYARDEEQMHALAAHLLATYADRPCTFILQNWEGDWLVRGDSKDWSKAVPADAEARFDSLAAWWRARQRGVDRARREAAPGGRCRVLHAAEVNRVVDATRGIPTATTHALPHAPVDLVSWSCYDGIDDPVTAWACLDLLERCGRRDGDGAVPVMVGEIGRPETGLTREDVVAWWDQALGVLLARRVAFIFHWALYCNEPRDRARRHEDMGPNVSPDEMRGFWWIRPDGTTSWGGEYLERVLARAGARGLD